MNGAHDMGGRMGFGMINPEANEPVFHEPWEGRVFALALALGVHDAWSIDEDRHACENRAPAEYLRLSYYQIWDAAMRKLLIAKGMVSEKEMRDGGIEQPFSRSTRALQPSEVGSWLLAAGSYRRDAKGPARFAVGDRVRARNINPVGHTRLPRYVRGRTGTVARLHGAHVFPDVNAYGGGENPQWLYTVRFSALDLWGVDRKDIVHVELWEPYLEAI